MGYVSVSQPFLHPFCVKTFGGTTNKIANISQLFHQNWQKREKKI